MQEPQSYKNVNTTVVLTSNYNSSAIELGQMEVPFNQLIGSQCNYNQDVIKHRCKNSVDQFGEQLPLSMLIKKNCRNCGAFISKIRKTNIEKIFYFGEKLRQSLQTMHLACAYFDVILIKEYLKETQKRQNQSAQAIPVNLISDQLQSGSDNQDLVISKTREKQLGLKAQMCLLLASKFDELDDYIPMIKDLQKISRYEFTYQECKEEEETVLMQLGWKLNLITPFHFIESFIGQGVIFEDDKIQADEKLAENKLIPFNDDKLRQVRKKAEYFCKLAITSDANFLKNRPSIIAVSCILASRMANQVVPLWNEKLQELTQMDINKDLELKSFFDNLYLLSDKTYKPQSISFLLNSKLKKHNSIISSCEANTLENTQINNIVLNNNSSKIFQTYHDQQQQIFEIKKQQRVLESNQNIVNDSFIISDTKKSFILVEKNQIQEESENKLQINIEDEEKIEKLIDENESTMNYEIDLAIDDDSILMLKKSIDHIPESLIAHRQSQLTLNFHLTQGVKDKNQSRIPLQYNFNKDKQIDKRNLKQDFRENQFMSIDKVQQVNSLMQKRKSQQVRINKENQANQKKVSDYQNQKQVKQGRLSHNPQKQPSSQRDNSIVQKQKQIIMQIDTSKQQNQYNLLKNQRETSKTKKQQAIQHLFQKDIQKQKNQNQNQSSSELQNEKHKNIEQRQILLKLNKHQTDLQTNIKEQAKLDNENKSLYYRSNNDYMNGCPIQVKQANSSRNSTSIGLNDQIQSQQLSDNKIHELKLKYQTQNTIYEKRRGQKGQKQNSIEQTQGRNSSGSLVGGQHAHSKTYATLQTAQNIQNKQQNNFRERSQSDLDLWQNPYGYKAYTSSQTPLIKQDHQPTLNKNVKNLIVVEDDHEHDKSCFDQSLTQNNIEEHLKNFDGDFIVVKRPISSQKSKSLENVNKLIQKQRKLSISNQGVIDIYKRQQQNNSIQSINQIYEQNKSKKRDKSSSQQPTKIATIDLLNNQCNNLNSSRLNSNNNIANIKCSQQSSVERADIINAYKATSLVNSKRTSRCSVKKSSMLNNHLKSSQKHNLSNFSSKYSISNRRASYCKQINSKSYQYLKDGNVSTFNSSQVLNKLSQDNIMRKSTQQMSLNKIINSQKSKESIKIDQNRISSQDMKNQKSNVSSDKFQNQKNLTNNLNSSSSQVQLKDRPYQKFLNPECKQFFTNFSKNFKNKVKSQSPDPIQISQQAFTNQEISQVHVISPQTSQILAQSKLAEYNNINSSLKQQSNTSATNPSSQYLKLKMMRQGQQINQIQQRSNNSTSFELGQGPQLSNRSGNFSQRTIESQNQSLSGVGIIKFQKFQARRPMKGQNYSLIERALLKKSQITNIMKQFETYQAANTLDNTCESTYEDKESNKETFCGAILKKFSANNSALAMPAISQSHQASARNIRVSHAKSPSQLMGSSYINPQDFPNQGGKTVKANLSSSVSFAHNNQGMNNNLTQNQSSHYPQKILKGNDTKVQPKKLQSSSTLIISPQQQYKQSQIHLSIIQSKLPTIQAPVSARVSNRYEFSTTHELIIREEDEFAQFSSQYKKYIEKIDI